MNDLKDTIGMPYSTWHGNPANSGESVTNHTSTGPKDGTMVGGYVVENK